jgi:hypothetical protein
LGFTCANSANPSPPNNDRSGAREARGEVQR